MSYRLFNEENPSPVLFTLENVKELLAEEDACDPQSISDVQAVKELSHNIGGGYWKDRSHTDETLSEKLGEFFLSLIPEATPDLLVAMSHEIHNCFHEQCGPIAESIFRAGQGNDSVIQSPDLRHFKYKRLDVALAKLDSELCTEADIRSLVSASSGLNGAEQKVINLNVISSSKCTANILLDLSAVPQSPEVSAAILNSDAFKKAGGKIKAAIKNRLQ